MRVRIVNLGPVRSAEIELSPLMIFVGPNNSGKSFAATTLHGILSRFARDETLINFGRNTLRPSVIPDDMAEMAYETISAKSKPALSDVPESLREYLETTLRAALEQYCSEMMAEVERVAGVQASELRRMRAARRPVGSLSVEFGRPEWSLTVRIATKRTISKVECPALQAVWGAISARSWRRIGLRSNQIARRPHFHLREIVLELFRTCFLDAPTTTRYLPAARSGLMQSHKILSGSLIRQASLAGIRSMSIPAMSGVVTEFLSELVELDNDVEGPFAQTASQIEASLLHGHVELSDERHEPAEVMYRTDLGTLPLSRTSSMISELAPIVLYLRNLVDRGELLFIEEPEAHLHPAAQIELAKALTELVNQGLRIGLTTHSEFFLQQLSNYMLATSLGEDSQRALFGTTRKLDLDSVAAYRFEPGVDGTVVSRLPQSSTEGISNVTFDEVSEHLYDEMTMIEQRIANES